MRQASRLPHCLWRRWKLESKVNLYFQFLTQDQSAGAIDLIKIPQLLFRDGTPCGRMKVSSEGVVSSSRFSGIDALAARLAKRQFNQLELGFDVEKLKFGRISAAVQSVNGVFTPAITSTLWMPSRKWTMAVDGIVGYRWMMANACERELKSLGVKHMPSIFELVVELKKPFQEQFILGEFGDWLANTLPESFERLGLFGCCDAGGPELFVKIEAGVPMTDGIRVMHNVFSTDYAALGLRFEALHPLMFGYKKTCAGIKDALGNYAKLTIGRHAKDFAVISLYSGCNISIASLRAASWLISPPTLHKEVAKPASGLL